MTAPAFRLKEVQTWTNGDSGDVLAFLGATLPGSAADPDPYRHPVVLR